MAEYDNNLAEVTDNGVETNGPKPSTDTKRIGEPSVPALARGVIKGTLQQAAALNREHNCDICAPVNKELAVVKAEVMIFVGQLRTSIEGIFAGLAANPAVEDIKQQISAVKAKIKLVKKEIEPIQEQIKALQEYAQEMQKLIQEIQNAPAELQALLQACLTEATASLTSTIKEVADIASGGITGAVAAIVDPISAEVKELTDAANQVTDTTPLS